MDMKAMAQRRYEYTPDGEPGTVAVVVTLDEHGNFRVYGKPGTAHERSAEETNTIYKGVPGEAAWERYVNGSSGLSSLHYGKPVEMTDKLKRRIRSWARGEDDQ